MTRLLPLLLAVCANSALAQCPPATHTRDQLRALAAADFVVEPAPERNALALDLLGCLGDPDPGIRDGVAFEALSNWLRGGALEAGTIDSLRARLVAGLAEPDDDRQLRHSFMTLVLSEVARADRLQPVFIDAQRRELVTLAAQWMRNVRDYRGFEEGVGWRHRVAHTADLVLQLAVNPQVGKDEVVTLLDALATQIAPAGIAYTHGEGDRFARVAYFVHQRKVLDRDWWEAWLARIAAATAGTSQLRDSAGIARRHSTLAFLYALHFAGAANATDDRARELQALAQAAIERVLGS